MVNDREQQHTDSATADSSVDDVVTERSAQLPIDLVLDARQAHHESQGMLAELTGTSLSSRPPFSVDRRGKGRTSRADDGIAVHGDLDYATVPMLNAVFATVDAALSLSFVIDLTHLTFVDVCGMRALDDGAERFGAVRPTVLAPASPYVRRTLLFAVRRGWLAKEFATPPPGV